jgi:nicotinate phosphoribosyltransferase
MTTYDQRIAEGILFTDQYQLTMAQLYYRMGLHELTVQFDHYFRRYPDYGTHQAGYCVAAGMADLLEWMGGARFGDAEIAALRAQTTRAGTRLFADDFLEWLRAEGDFAGLSLRAIPEGRVVHPHAPLTVVRGPLAMAQIIETALLNALNYPTLVATKAARIRDSARGRPLLEFGLRRAQGAGANAGTRAALIGGADFSSNVGISARLGFQARGTHAHSMVQTFMALGEGELGAFRAYAEIYPDDCLLLVDTINTLESGLPNAITVFEELRRKGHEPSGIRLDSGDLAYLSIQAARMLDAAGFPLVSIVLSNDLDELMIWQIITQIAQEAPRYGVDPDALVGRLVLGVGTRLITSAGEPALGGVYKLVALQKNGAWTPAIKIAESPEKTATPGNKQVWRVYDRRGKATLDLLAHDNEDPRQGDRIVARHPSDHAKWRALGREEITAVEPLLVEVWRDGGPVGDTPSIDELRGRRVADVERLDVGVRRLINPHIYHVALTERLWDLRQQMIADAQRR